MRVVIAEDQFLLREGLVRMLEVLGCEVVDAVGSAPELQRCLASSDMDIAVVDIRLPPSFTDEGLRVAVAARKRRPGLPVLVLSQYVETLYARELLEDRRGGVGYLLKDRVFNADQFLEAMETVRAGGTWLDPSVVARIMERKRAQPTGFHLTPRETATLSHMAEGKSNAAIARTMFITEKAVAKNVNSIFAKLGLPPSEDDNRRVLAVLQYLEVIAPPCPQEAVAPSYPRA